MQSMIPDIYNVEEADGLADFAFDFDKQDMISASGHEDVIEDKLFNMSSLDQFASDTGLFPQVQAPLPLRPYRSVAKATDRASPTISGSELRTLEGRRPSAEVQIVSLGMPTSSSTASSYAAPTLRRKGRIGPSMPNAPRYNGTQQNPRDNSNDAISDGLQSPEMPMSPSSCEWTQKFQQQISLHTRKPELFSPQIQHFQDVQREGLKQVDEQLSPRDLSQHRKAYSNQPDVGASYSHMVDYSQQISQSIPSRDTNAPLSMLPAQPSHNTVTSPGRDQSTNIPQGSFRQHRHTQSWAHTPTGLTSDCTVSPSQIHSSWVHGLPIHSTGYFPNLAYATPTSQDPTATLFSQEEMGTSSSYGSPGLPLNHHSSSTNLATSDDVVLNSLANRHPQTPPPSDPSASPPTPEVIPSPQKQHQQQSRTATSRRHANSNALRLRKSTATLKPAKSLSALKSTKSAGHLRGKKSIGGGSSSGSGLNHHHSQSYNANTTTTTTTNHHNNTNTKSPIKKERSQPGGMNFGFLNYTADDKQKILTGVAPSGSSKTKARRELEAHEEKRRLSLAAIRAIEVAGGDSEGLRRQLKVEVET